jgi:hypothetical protein
MIDLSDKQLSEAIFELSKELNRGAWLADRFGGADGGIGCEAIRSVKVKARVTVLPGSVLVESVSLSHAGPTKSVSTESGSQQQTSVSSAVNSTTVENSSQSQGSQSNNLQSGGNKNTTINDYGEV